MKKYIYTRIHIIFVHTRTRSKVIQSSKKLFHRFLYIQVVFLLVSHNFRTLLQLSKLVRKQVPIKFHENEVQLTVQMLEIQDSS